MKMNIRDKEIMHLAIPSIVTNVTIPLLGLVDLAIVGHVGNATLIGAIAVGSMIFNVMYWLMGFLRMGTSGMTAQAYGVYLSTQKSSLSSILRGNLRMALLIALGFLVLQLPLRWVSLWLMEPSNEVAALVRVYFNICIWGAPAVLSLYVMTGWFIGMQNTRTPMVVSIAQNLINILASAILVFGFGMKIEGVALGTLIAQWSGAAMAFYGTLRERQKVTETAENTTLPTFRSSFSKVNADLFLRTLFMVAVNLFFTSVGARQGDVLLSVNTLLMTFFMVFSYVMDGFAYAGEALCGKSFGAKDWMLFRATNRRLFLWGAVMVVVFTAVYAFGGRAFLSLLTSDEMVIEAAQPYLPWILLIPVTGVAAFLFDGIFVGMLATRGMLVSCAVATMVFFAVYFNLFPQWGNHALWLALMVYLALRGIIQWLWMMNLAKAAS